MSNSQPRTPEVDFPLRRDQNGYRAVYKLGNERGDCPFQCRFCGVGKSPKVSSEANVALFDTLHSKFMAGVDGPYHAAIFNRGNVTDRGVFSVRTLDHVLSILEKDRRVTYVSLNSRESTASAEVLDWLLARNLPFPIHFIFGQESLSDNALTILGKTNRGELERFVEKLKPYNRHSGPKNTRKSYVFGLDANLVFLPELYLRAGESRKNSESTIAEGLAADLRKLLSHTDPLVPAEVNIHPYYEVAALPYEKADLLQLLRILPALQLIVEEHNRKPGVYRTHLFVGVVFLTEGADRASAPYRSKKLSLLKEAIDGFNKTGELPGYWGEKPVENHL